MVTGNISGEGTSGVKKNDENCRQEMNFSQEGLLLQSNSNGGIPEPMAQSPLQGSRAFHPPSPIIIPQVPIIPSPRRGLEMQSLLHALQPNTSIEYVVHEKFRHAKILWNHGGKSVAVTGSWDNWSTSELLQSTGQGFILIKSLPSGVYHYRFIVDGYLTFAPDFPWDSNDSGYVYNTLDLQDYIPEMLSWSLHHESPPSPPSSYDNRDINDDEFSKPPPELPPQLPVTFSNEYSPSTDSPQSLSRPTHLELNHLYIHKNDRDPYVVLRSTERFHQEYVTMFLYKSLRR